MTPRGAAGKAPEEPKWSQGRGQKQLQQLLMRIAQFAQRNKLFDGLCFAGCAEPPAQWQAEPRAVDPSCQVHAARGKCHGMMQDRISCRCGTWGKLVLQQKCPL